METTNTRDVQFDTGKVLLLLSSYAIRITFIVINQIFGYNYLSITNYQSIIYQLILYITRILL